MSTVALRVDGVEQPAPKMIDRAAAREKAELVRRVLKASPSRSDVSIARECETSPKTVAKYRAQLEANAQIEKSETRSGADGRDRTLPKKRHAGCEQANKPNARKEAGRLAASWARGYVALAVALSIGLNSYANYRSSIGEDTAGQILAVALGAMVPLLVLILGKVASLVWQAGHKQLAGGMATVGCSVLALSVVHCTEAIQCAGSPYVLALLMAIGIDCGLVGSEIVATVVEAS